jgi:hypothetical protein
MTTCDVVRLEHRALNLHHHRIPELVEGLFAFFLLVPPRAKKKISPSTSSGIRRVLANSDKSLPALANVKGVDWLSRFSSAPLRLGVSALFQKW